MRNKFMIKMIVYFGVMLTVATGTALSRDMTVESRWTAEPVTLDGINKEWPVETLEMFESAKVQFSFRNDRENLYIYLVFTDAEFVSSLKETGISVYINTKGKEKKDDGFLFKTVVIAAQDIISFWEKKGQPLNDTEKQEVLRQPQYYQYAVQLIRKKKKQDFPKGEGAAGTRPVFRVTENESLPTYEFKIPLSLMGLKTGAAATSGQIIKVGFEWGGLTDEKRKELMTRRASEAVDSDTKHDDYYSQMQNFGFLGGPKEYSFWVDLKLASAPKAP